MLWYAMVEGGGSGWGNYVIVGELLVLVLVLTLSVLLLKLCWW